MRNLEESLFWEILYRHQAVRSELARLFDVSAATISRSAGVLLAKHLIVETGATKGVTWAAAGSAAVEPGARPRCGD